MKAVCKLVLMSILMCICIIGICAEPSEELSFAEFGFVFLVTKLVGIGAGIAAYRLGGKFFEKVVEAVENE